MGNPWTPGPWNSDDLSVFDDDGDPICHMAMSITEEDKGTQSANARLVKHAPEMAEALRLWLAYDSSADDVSMMIRYVEALEATKAVYARIRGETL